MKTDYSSKCLKKKNLLKCECGNRGQAGELWIVEGSGWMRRVRIGDLEDDPLGRGGPVGRRESEAVVRARIQGVHLCVICSTYIRSTRALYVDEVLSKFRDSRH